jgi:hypothetical protein
MYCKPNKEFETGPEFSFGLSSAYIKTVEIIGQG